MPICNSSRTLVQGREPTDAFVSRSDENMVTVGVTAADGNFWTLEFAGAATLQTAATATDSNYDITLSKMRTTAMTLS